MQFDVRSSPPFAFGLTWSSVNDASSIGGVSQYAQRFFQASLID